MGASVVWLVCAWALAEDGADFIHASLEGGVRFTPDGPPELEATFRRDLPARLRAVPLASRYLGRPVSFVVTGAESGSWTVDFHDPMGTPVSRATRWIPAAA